MTETDRPLAPLLTFGPLWDDLSLEGAGEAELRAELRAQRAARATAEALWREVGQHIDAAAIGWNHPQIAAVFAINRTLSGQLAQARATAYAEGQRDAIQAFAARVEKEVENDASSTQSLANLLGHVRAMRDTPAPAEQVHQSVPATHEPVFVLRGKDRLAPAVVYDWVERARRAGVHPQKIAGAVEIAQQMEDFQRDVCAKLPD